MRLLTIAFIFFATFSFAQQITFKHLNIDDGLMNNIVYNLVQDDDGFVWVATQTGIDRYDGSSFKHYNLFTRKNNYDFSRVIAVKKDGKGNIWGATNNYLYIFNKWMDRFEPLVEIRTAVKRKAITLLYIDETGVLWLAVGNGLSLYKYDPGKRELSFVETYKTPVRSIFHAKNELFIGLEKGLLHYKSNGSKLSYLNGLSPLKRAGLDSLFITAIAKDDIGRWWFGTLNSGIYLYEPQKQNLRNLDVIDPTLKQHVIRDLSFSARNKKMYVAKDGGGVAVFDQQLKVVKYVANEDNPQSLSSNGVYHIFEDTYNRIWVSTFGAGINIYDPNKLPFISINHERNENNSLANNMAGAVVQDRSGRYWFGTQKGISVYDVKTRNWIQLNRENNKLSSNSVLSLLPDNAGNIWVGTYGQGPEKIEAQTNQQLHYPDEEKIKQLSKYTYTIYQDSSGNMWFGGVRGALICYNAKKRTIQQYPVNGVRCMFEYRKGIFLIGNSNKLSKLDISSNKTEVLTIPGLESVVYCIYQEQQSKTIWLGSQGNGLFKLDKNLKLSRVVNESNGLASNIICGILEDEKEQLWISTTNGLSCLIKKSYLIRNYSKYDGLPSTQFNYGSFNKSRDGEMVFGTTNGFVRFYPNQMNLAIVKPKILLLDFKIANKSAPVGIESSPLKRHINFVSDLKLSYSQNSFSFEFIGMRHANPKQIKYSWRLKGFESEWSPATSTTIANYTNIDPGDYEFETRASHDGFSWSKEIRRVHITITPPFWRSGVAYLVYFLLLVLLVIVGFYYFKTWLNQKHYKDRLQFFANVAHDIRTPLTLIKTPVTALLSRNTIKDDDRVNLKLVERNVERLNRFVNQLLDFQKADLNKMNLKVSRQNLAKVLPELLDSFAPLLASKEMQLIKDIPENELQVWIDVEKFEKIIYNLMSNAVKYTKIGGKIHVQLLKIDSYCEIRVKDNGIGIPEKQQKFIFNNYYRADNTVNLQETGSGVGLMLTKQLVELHKGKISFHSSKEKGTIFIVQLQLNPAFSEDEILDTEVIQDLSSADPKQSDIAEGGKGKLLIVEDNTELREYLNRELSATYQVYAAENGVKAIQIANQYHIDLILSDVMMPEMNGYQFCAAIKKDVATCHIPVILLTAINGMEYRIESMELGADDYIEKPFDLNYLKARIVNLLTSRASLKNKFLTVFDFPSVSEDGPNRLDTAFLNKAIKIVNDNIDNPDFSVEKLCQDAAVSRPVLFRKLKALTSQSPQDFIKIIRLKKAAELLHTKLHSVNEIAFLCGFADAKYFSTSFKKHFGVSPTLYNQRDSS